MHFIIHSFNYSEHDIHIHYLQTFTLNCFGEVSGILLHRLSLDYHFLHHINQLKLLFMLAAAVCIQRMLFTGFILVTSIRLTPDSLLDPCKLVISKNFICWLCENELSWKWRTNKFKKSSFCVQRVYVYFVIYSYLHLHFVILIELRGKRTENGWLAWHEGSTRCT